MNIDELEGVELADTICVDRGWIYAGGCKGEPVDTMLIGSHSVDIETTCFFYRPDGLLCAVGHEMRICSNYRPDLNIAQAWELDVEGWQWEFEEVCVNQYDDDDPPDWYRLDVTLYAPGTGRHEAEIAFADFSTKAQAYATARCRAFLKAKGAGK